MMCKYCGLALGPQDNKTSHKACVKLQQKKAGEKRAREYAIELALEIKGGRAR